MNGQNRKNTTSIVYGHVTRFGLKHSSAGNSKEAKINE